MQQQTLDAFESAGGDTECPTCGEIYPHRRLLGSHHSEAHGETLLEYEQRVDGVQRIECPKGCGKYEALNVHWGRIHGDEPFPDGVRKITDSVRQSLSEPLSGVPLSGEHRQKISEGVQGKMAGKDHPKYGMPVSEKTRKKISKAQSDKTLSEETKRKISEAHTDIPLSEEHRQKISESLIGENNPMHGGSFSEDHRRKISESLSGRTLSEDHIEKALRGLQGKMCIIATRHEVRNKWERDVDLILHNAGCEHEYEPELFDIGNGWKYLPDFIVGDDVIEVKGRDFGRAVPRAKMFMKTHPEYRYIVVGTELPSDVWLPWDERDRLIDVLNAA